MSHSFIIFSNNRPLLLKESIQYFIQYNYPREKIIIYDNSSEDYKSKIYQLAHEYQLQIIPNTTESLGEHFLYALNDCNSDYVTFFHDDDLINLDHFDYQKKIESYFKKKNIISINFNGFNFENKKTNISKKSLWTSDSKELKILKKDLIERYLNNDKGGIAPWSGYVYNLKIYKKIIIEILNNINLKDPYFDTHLIIKMLDHGDIYWIDLQAYLIRLHDGSISHNTLRSYMQFINYVKLNHPAIEKKSIKIYRYRNLLIFLIKKKKFKILSIYLLVYLFFNSRSLRKLILIKIYKVIKKIY